jgi:hypothetical protein
MPRKYGDPIEMMAIGIWSDWKHCSWDDAVIAIDNCHYGYKMCFQLVELEFQRTGRDM